MTRLASGGGFASHTRILDDMESRLTALAEIRVQEWWERYLKGEACFRGVKMAATRRVTRELWNSHELETRSIAQIIDLARACMACEPTEDKLVGVLFLAEHALSELELKHAPKLAKPLADGSLADWNSVDWYCVKCLGPFLEVGDDVEARARAIAGWVDAKGLWQRRAAAVAFTKSAAREEELFPGFHELMIQVCEKNVTDPARWSQTSVGWLLRELSRNHAPLVQAFVNAHPEMSTEARKNATKYL